METGLAQHISEIGVAIAEIAEINPEFSLTPPKSVAEGAATTLVALLDDSMPSGAYLSDCVIEEPSSLAQDDQLCEIGSWHQSQLIHCGKRITLPHSQCL